MSEIEDTLGPVTDATTMRAERSEGYEFRRFKPQPPAKRAELQRKAAFRAALNRGAPGNPRLKLRDFSGGDA